MSASAILAAIETVGARARDYGADLARWRADPGFANIAVRARDDGRLLILSYTDRATYAGVWTPLERACRGLIVEAGTGSIVARPWGKFFNWFELEEGERARLAAVGIADVTTKEDGSLAVIYHHDGAWHAATRGAFDSPQARWADAAIKRVAAEGALLVSGYTYLAEIIHPGNRIVIDYGGRSDLVLLGVVGREDGVDLPREDVERVGMGAGLPVVEWTPAGDVAGLSDAQEAGRDQEGWVARFRDGTRVKFKTRWYLDLHRLISGFNAERVRAAYIDSAIPALRAALPEEFHAELDGLHSAIHLRYCALRGQIERWHEELRASDTGGKDGRAAFAATVIARAPTDLRAHIFALHDGKLRRDKLAKQIDVADLMPTVGGFSSWRGEEG